MHLLRKQKKKEKDALQIQKSMQKEPGRAGGQRPAAWPGGKHQESMHLNLPDLPAKPAAVDKVCT